jgi:DNA ligase-1
MAMSELSASFARFCQTAEKIEATRSRLRKAAELAACFRDLGDADLARAARYFAGQVFPLKDQRAIQVGAATLLEALAQATGIPKGDLQRALVRLGDLGDVAAETLSREKVPGPITALTLARVQESLEALAEVSGPKGKAGALLPLLSRAGRLEGRFLVKLILGDLRIGLQEGALEDAIARAFGASLERVRWANMLVGDVGEVALLARSGGLERARLQLFHPLKFMLASPVETHEDAVRAMPEGFAVEDKYDGIRAQLHVRKARPGEGHLHGTVFEGARVALFSRTLDEITRSFPEMLPEAARILRASGHQALILDGELLSVRAGRIQPFSELQKRLGRRTPGDAVQAEIPVGYRAFDVLALDSEVLMTLPYRERRRRLEALPLRSARVEAAPMRLHRSAEEIQSEFEAARSRRNEGLVLKRLDAPYQPGRRGRDWIKIKQPLATLDVVVTAVEVGNGRRRALLSDFTFAVRASGHDATLLNVGKAYSGLTDSELEELTRWFEAHTRQQFAHGRVRVVEPEIVIEVTFDRVQRSPRHRSGYALRFPRIVRLRTDKPVSEIDTLETVARLAEDESRRDRGVEAA